MHYQSGYAMVAYNTVVTRGSDMTKQLALSYSLSVQQPGDSNW